MSCDFARNPLYFTDEHRMFRDSVRAFVEREIAPHVDAWDEAGRIPRELYRRAGELGLLGLGFPEAFGGTPADAFHKLIYAEELARAGSGGVQAALGSLNIALPPLVDAGDAALQAEVLPAVLAGEKIAALAITEPGGGSDVAGLATRAVRDGDHYVVNGDKVFITSGLRADVLMVAVRTDPETRGARGISLLLIDGDTPGLEKTELKKMGWWASDTAQLRFVDCRVPASRLVGPAHGGFGLVMHNFNAERMNIAIMAYSYAAVCYDEALAWARARNTFGVPLVERQVIRHKLMDMAMRIDATRALAHELAYAIEHNVGSGAERVARICLLKNLATQTMQFCADQAVQMLGGMGYMRGSKCERIYREAKVLMIGGGAEEIMKDLAARQLGL